MTENLEDHNPTSLLGTNLTGWVQTPLQLAVSIGNLDCVKILVARSALEDSRNKRKGGTPLDLARKGHHYDVLEFLLMQTSPPN